MLTSLKDDEWNNLLKLIKKKQCTPFIGAGACAGVLPTGKELANKLAENDFPFKDSNDLSRVSQYMAIKEFDMFPKDAIKDTFEKEGQPDFSKPEEPHGILADLDLPIYITTNYDDFMYKALESRRKKPRREFCRWNKMDQVLKYKPILHQSYVPSAEEPLVYHLHGHTEIPQSMVLTESDYLDFLIRLQDKKRPLLPTEITEALTASALLFIGYSLSDWSFRVVFRGLTNSLRNLGYFAIAVQLPPGDVKEGKEEIARDYMVRYFAKVQDIKVSVYWGNATDFSKELRNHWEEFKNAN